jgi:hypothetical protein
VTWALNTKKLSVATTRLYLSDLKNIHKQKNLCTSNFSDFFCTSMLQGAQNLSLYNGIVNRSRLAMTFPLLKIIGHEISNSDWSVNSKRVVWAASCVAFFGSFRMGELLASKENCMDSETLTWDCVNFTSESTAVIQVRFPKNSKNGSSQFVDIFKVDKPAVCPYECLKNLKNSSSWSSANDSPVFRFETGKLLTTGHFTKIIRSLLRPHLGNLVQQFSGHSFRAGIPAALANHPSLLSNDDVRKWGRWSSSSYLAYTKLKLAARKEIFNKLLYVIEM